MAKQPKKKGVAIPVPREKTVLALVGPQAWTEEFKQWFRLFSKYHTTLMVPFCLAIGVKSSRYDNKPSFIFTIIISGALNPNSQAKGHHKSGVVFAEQAKPLLEFFGLCLGPHKSKYSFLSGERYHCMLQKKSYSPSSLLWNRTFFHELHQVNSVRHIIITIIIIIIIIIIIVIVMKWWYDSVQCRHLLLYKGNKRRNNECRGVVSKRLHGEKRHVQPCSLHYHCLPSPSPR